MTVVVQWVSNNGQRWEQRYHRIASMRHSDDGKRITLVHQGGTETLLYTQWMLSIAEGE